MKSNVWNDKFTIGTAVSVKAVIIDVREYEHNQEPHLALDIGNNINIWVKQSAVDRILAEKIRPSVVRNGQD